MEGEAHLVWCRWGFWVFREVSRLKALVKKWCEDSLMNQIDCGLELFILNMGAVFVEEEGG